MKVDVIYITYNQKDYVDCAIDSIFMQRIGEGVDVRIIVADDYSTDGSREYIKEKMKNSPFPYIFIDNKKNVGLEKNYISAFKQCKGDFVLILEGDDYWVSPYHISNHVSFLDIHHECSMSINRFICYNVSKYIFIPVFPKQHVAEFINLKQQIADGNQLGNLSACCFRTKLLNLNLNKLTEISFADWLLGMIMAQYGLIAKLNTPTSVYRIMPNSLWSGMSASQQSKAIKKATYTYDEFFDKKYSEYFHILRRKQNRFLKIYYKIKIKLKHLLLSKSL